ncbi:hypothetical protein [Egbenema bharatensis]|uniref:hypothetical protein n=1 Tax=Egbenema bharatensis TaxID=3463334 RepID=UPI003A8A5839
MKIVICPGIHAVDLTQQFVMSLGKLPNPVLVFPTDRYPAYSGWHIVQFLQAGSPELAPDDEILLIGFSAGVVGAASAAVLWQGLGKSVKALIAIDGWGVPLWGNFPIYRVSHDSFTHWSSALLGSGNESFYADPPVDHLELWRSPQRSWGWQVRSGYFAAQAHRPITACQFIQQLLSRHHES